MNKYFFKLCQGFLLVIDLVSVNIGFIAVNYFYTRQLFISSFVEYNNFLYFLNVSWIAISVLCGVYSEKNIISFESFSRRSMHAFVYFMGMIMIYLFFLQHVAISRIFISVLLVSISFLLFLNRFFYLAIYQYFRKKDYLIHRIIILGYNKISKKLVEYLEKNGVNTEIVGFCEEYEKIEEVTNYPVLDTIEQTLQICKTYDANEIYSTIAPEQNKKIYELIHKAEQNCIRFKLIPDLGFFIKQKLHIDYIDDLPVISLRKEPLEDLGNKIRKRIFDIVVSLLVIIFILSFLLPVVGLLILFESKGPVFFKQLRSGRNNRSFYCLKFRSMYVNKKSDILQATANDSRITRIGKILRHTSLDEFPQFINVLKGEMSIVGPRPHMLKHTTDYSQKIGKFMVRQFVKPGITGWAQVNGFRGETKTLGQMEKRMEHDLWYLENWSLWLDVRIIFLTIYNVFSGDLNAH
ncbi:MAG TPA: undecaprenyl-phosphate glucose phosphotransferase [Puia sp.]|jgi:putative colanic acid biosynthesis UDP-glucose lipid carrier transferase|nr:undecaprenyl-phosphate glucose phosphotransferase [Puia sp.]